MILKVAWRNIWRNKTRSLVVIMAIMVGLWAGVFASAFVIGMMEQKINSVILQEMSHFQVHHINFRDELQPKFTLPNGNEKIQILSNDNDVKGVSGRVLTTAMISTPNGNGSIKATGIAPTDEIKVSTIHQYLVQGEYLQSKYKNPIVISQKTADEYKVKMRSKVVLTMQDAEGEITAGAFRVVGIFETENLMYDGLNVFVDKADLQELLGIEDQIHEIAVLLKSHDRSDQVTQYYQGLWPKVEVLSWKDLATGMRFFVEAKDTYMAFIVGIILTALLFSIVNTMLMAVLERVREIGMLMAVGMGKLSVFQMVVYETIMLSILGGPLGLLLSWLSIKYFGEHGINLGNAAYSSVGFSNIVYPHLDAYSYFTITLMVMFMSVLASIYPAIKALKLKPIEAIRKI